MVQMIPHPLLSLQDRLLLWQKEYQVPTDHLLGSIHAHVQRHWVLVVYWMFSVYAHSGHWPLELMVCGRGGPSVWPIMACCYVNNELLSSCPSAHKLTSRALLNILRHDTV